MVVVVDDQTEVLQTVGNLLSASGFTVHLADHAVAAIELLRSLPSVSLLLTDINMPGIDGVMLADMVKKRHPGVSVVYMTGRADRAPRERGISHGPTILKPFRIDELVATVKGSCCPDFEAPL